MHGVLRFFGGGEKRSWEKMGRKEKSWKIRGGWMGEIGRDWDFGGKKRGCWGTVGCIYSYVIFFPDAFPCPFHFPNFFFLPFFSPPIPVFREILGEGGGK